MKQLLAIRFWAKELRSPAGSLVVSPEAPHWVMTAIGSEATYTGKPCEDDKEIDWRLVIFRSQTEVDEFMRSWPGHPWYLSPVRWEAVPVVRKYSRVTVEGRVRCFTSHFSVKEPKERKRMSKKRRFFAVKFKTKEIRASSGESVITPRGAVHWLVKDDSGWVPATSRVVNERVPADLLIFESMAKANAFMRQWRGHPWYVVPATWKVIPVEACHKRVFSHYVIKGKA